MRFVREPKMVQEVRIGFDNVAKSFIRGYTCFHVHLRKILLYINLVKMQMKVFFKNTPKKLLRDSQQLTELSK